MSKKLILALVIITLLVGTFILASCAPKPAPPPAPKPPAPALAPAPAPKPEVITWIGQDDNPATFSTYLSFERVGKAIELASGGRLIIKTHPGGAIVPTDRELEPTSKGVLDIASQGPGLWKDWLPVSPRFSFMVAGPTAMEYFFWFMYGDGFKLMQEMLDSKNFNVKPIASVAREAEVFLYSNKPIKKVEDLKGMKIRLMGDEAVVFGKLGVAGVATPSPEIYEAMKRGVLDAFQHSSLAADVGMGFYEIVKYAYMSPVRQSSDNYVYIVNKDSWAKLPADLKKLVEDLMWAEGIRHYGEWTYKNTLATAKWQEKGVIIEPAPKELEDALIKIATEFYTAEAAKDPFYDKVMKSLTAWRDAYMRTWPRL